MEEKIKTILVDDEVKSIQIIRNLLEKFGPQFDVTAVAMTGQEAIDKIHAYRPGLVFLDISLPDCDGFYVLSQCKDIDFEVIFITAHDNFAIKAFEMAAIHYLLKPVSYQDFQEALKRFEDRRGTHASSHRHEVLNEAIQNKPGRIVLPSLNGYTFVDLDEVVRCQAESNYTQFFLTGNRKVMVSRTMNFYEELLSGLQFCRVHNKHMVNLNHVMKFVRGKGGTLVMADQSAVEISEGRKKELLDRLKDHALGI